MELSSYNKLLCSKICKTVKLKIYKTVVKPVVTNKYETWTLKQNDLIKQTIVERRMLRNNLYFSRAQWSVELINNELPLLILSSSEDFNG